MFVRNAALATMLLVLALLFTSAAAGAPAKTPTSPKGPTNLRITASGPTSVSLAWDAATGGNSTNWWYCVQSGGAGCFRVNPPQTTFTHPSLWPGTTYTFTVITVDSNGHRSAPSNAVTYTTPPDTTPPTAPELRTTSVFPTRVGLSWTASVDNRTQVSYTLLVDGSPYFGGFIGYRSIVIPYLAPSSTHVFKVVARDSFGNASESNVLTVPTPPATEGVRERRARQHSDRQRRGHRVLLGIGPEHDRRPCDRHVGERVSVQQRGHLRLLARRSRRPPSRRPPAG